MIVIKIGGSEGTDYQTICADIAARIKAGDEIVVVHAGRKSFPLGEHIRAVALRSLAAEVTPLAGA